MGNQARSSYHGMQLRIDSLRLRRFGLQYGLNYTWSHSLDNVSSLVGDDSVSGGAGLPLDAFDPDLDKGPSDHDVRHRMVGHFVWQIPGAARTRGLTRLLLAGWQFSGIVSFQSGQPFSLWDGRVFDRELSDNTRPRLTGQAPECWAAGERQVDVRTPNAFLSCPSTGSATPMGAVLPMPSPSAVNYPSMDRLTGLLGRNTFRRPGTHFQNVALAKNIDLPEMGGVEGSAASTPGGVLQSLQPLQPVCEAGDDQRGGLVLQHGPGVSSSGSGGLLRDARGFSPGSPPDRPGR